MKKGSIGIFDSGLGGLQIFRHIHKKLPQYNYIYLGDTARVPYGSRSQETVFKFTKQAVDFLFKNNCQLIIFACNTVSSKALRLIQREYLPKYYPERKVLGIIIPTVEEAVEKKNVRIGIIATEGSVNSGAFIRETKKLNSKVKVFQKACPLLVPIVEAGEENSKIADLALEKYLKPMLKNSIVALILGCTHYGFLENKIKKIVGKNVKVINEGKVVAEKLEEYLKRHPEIEKNLKKDSKVKIYTTDMTNKFQILGSKFMGKKIIPIRVALD